MSGKAKANLTKEAVLAAVEAGATTMSEVVHRLGYKSVCGATTKKIRALVPDIGERLGGAKGKGEKPAPTAKAAKPQAAKVKKTPKPAKNDSRTEYPRAESNPFREGSAYATGYDILAAAGDKGIERAKLVAEVARITGKDPRKAYFDVTVVASSRKDGRSHRCIAKAADSYYVERTDGGWLKLVVRDRKF